MPNGFSWADYGPMNLAWQKREPGDDSIAEESTLTFAWQKTVKGCYLLEGVLFEPSLAEESQVMLALQRESSLTLAWQKTVIRDFVFSKEGSLILVLQKRTLCCHRRVL